MDDNAIFIALVWDLGSGALASVHVVHACLAADAARYTAHRGGVPRQISLLATFC